MWTWLFWRFCVTQSAAWHDRHVEQIIITCYVQDFDLAMLKWSAFQDTGYDSFCCCCLSCHVLDWVKSNCVCWGFLFLFSWFLSLFCFFVYVCATFSPLVASHFICDFLAFEQRLFCLTWMLTVSHQMYTPEIFSCQRKDEFSIFLCKLYFGLSCFLICEDLRGCKTRKGLLQCSLCACVGKDRHSECVSLLVTPHTRTHTHWFKH